MKIFKRIHARHAGLVFFKTQTYNTMKALSRLPIMCFLFFGLYLDVSVYGNEERWWLWDVYTVTVNIMDISMLIALLTNKDFFKLVALVNFFRSKQSIEKAINA